MHPSLFQINPRVWLQRLSREAGRPITLADIDDTTIDGFAENGFDWIWLLSVWQTGTAGRAVSRGNPQWRAEFQGVLPDLTEDDICGSGFAITGYTASEALGGERALALLRKKLARRGIKLMLDFVPNHNALDHPWVKTHPDYYVEGAKLLKLLKDTGAFRDGGWSQIRPLSAWSGNWTSDGFVAYAWAAEDSRYVVVVNYADNQGQCRLCLPFPELRGKQVRLTDVMGTEIFDRDGSELVDAGLYIDHDPWHFNIFELQAA